MIVWKIVKYEKKVFRKNTSKRKTGKKFVRNVNITIIKALIEENSVGAFSYPK